jgi:prepilin-type N-terminal cleavage/methylation domain-containing protein
MPMRKLRGFTLIELLVSLVIMGIVTGSIYTLLNTSQRVSRAQSERAELQSNIRTGAIIVPAELRELNGVVAGGAGQNDLIAMNADNITYRGMRGIGFACQAPTASEIRLLRSTWSGYRDPAATDSVYVFIENNPDVSTDDSWVQARISAVNTGNVCGANAGITLTINPSVPGLAAAGVNAPVRTWERMELKLYVSGGESWLGARSVSAGEAVQPMLGPLTAGGDGFGLEYLNATGGTATTVDQVKSIRVTLKGLTDQAIVAGTSSSGLQHVRDSLVTQVSLRNALR